MARRKGGMRSLYLKPIELIALVIGVMLAVAGFKSIGPVIFALCVIGSAIALSIAVRRNIPQPFRILTIAAMILFAFWLGWKNYQDEIEDSIRITSGILYSDALPEVDPDRETAGAAC